MIIMVIIIIVKFVLISKLEDEKTLGIIKNIEKGLSTPPVRYNKELS